MGRRGVIGPSARQRRERGRVMAAGEQDVVLRFLARFAAMSEHERDDALDGLSPVDREALIALAQARTATAQLDLLGVLSAGHEGLELLVEIAEPADLLTVIDLAMRERPEMVVEALFAGVVLHRRQDAAEPLAIAALREQWQLQVHERIATAERAGADEH